MADEEFFWRGKLVNIILSLVLLVLLYAVLRRFINEFESQVIVLITAFTVFIYKAGYFQCELLFYFLNFCLFLLFWQAIKKPSLWIGFLSGLTAALAWLTKASVIPAVITFLSFCIVVPIVNVCVFKKRQSNNNAKYILKYISMIAVFLFVFLFTLYPYLSTSKKTFGHYFYNVNSTFYIWYDSWEDVKKGTRAYGDRVGWPQMPPEEIPSFSKYFQEHSLQQMFFRLLSGIFIILGTALISYGYLEFFCMYLLVCLAVIFKNRLEISAIIKRGDNLLIMLYIIAYFVIYYLLYAFYAPISAGPRLILAQFLPAMFTMVYFLSAIKFDFHIKSFNLHINNERVHVIVLYVLILYIVFQLPFRLQFYSGG